MSQERSKQDGIESYRQRIRKLIEEDRDLLDALDS